MESEWGLGQLVQRVLHPPRYVNVLMRQQSIMTDHVRREYCYWKYMVRQLHSIEFRVGPSFNVILWMLQGDE